MTNPSLASLLKEACELENDMSWDDEDALDELDRACLRGECLENARLQPLIEGMIEIVEALESGGALSIYDAISKLHALVAKERV